VSGATNKVSKTAALLCVLLMPVTHQG